MNEEIDAKGRNTIREDIKSSGSIATAMAITAAASMAFGNWLGGRQADRLPAPEEPASTTENQPTTNSPDTRSERVAYLFENRAQAAEILESIPPAQRRESLETLVNSPALSLLVGGSKAVSAELRSRDAAERLSALESIASDPTSICFGEHSHEASSAKTPSSDSPAHER